MASRRFFAYDPYDYYYTNPYQYPYTYYHHPAAPASRAPAREDYGGFFFPVDVEGPEPAVRAEVLRPRQPSRSSLSSVSVPVRFVGSESETDQPAREVSPVARVADTAVGVRRKRAPSAEEAAVRVQAAARGFLARRMVREVRDVEREAEGVSARVAADAEALRGDARGRVAVEEALMRLLLRLDAVRGVREYRRRVTKRVLALQDAVDALEPKPVEAPAMDEAAAADAMAEETVEMPEAEVAEEREMTPEMPPHAPDHSAEIGAETAAEFPATETAAEMEVDGGRAIGDEAGHDETDLVADGDKAEAAEGEWEMVTEQEAVAGENSSPKARQQEPAAEETEKNGGTAGGLDAKKVMEMVAALCERSAQQCSVIGALAERVDALERAVRRVEEADRRRRRNKKIKKEGKGNSKAARSCYSD